MKSLSKLPIRMVVAALIVICIGVSLLVFYGDHAETAVESFRGSRSREQAPFLAPTLKGGLGNQLFELATAFALAPHLGRELKITRSEIEKSIHSDKDYMSTIFQTFESLMTSQTATKVIQPFLKESEYPAIRNAGGSYQLAMYNHDWRKIAPIRAEFAARLRFNTDIASTVAKYPRLAESIFIHIRGGDFKDHAYLKVPLHDYYKSAVDMVTRSNSRGAVKHAYIFTNDRPYATAFAALGAIEHTFVDTNELDSLYLMSRCGRGGITGNSTFGWWGLYLNIQREFLIVPSRWIVEAHRPAGFYPNYIFPEARAISN